MSSFVFNRAKKLLQVWNNIGVTLNGDKIFYFWVNYPFKKIEIKGWKQDA